MRQWGQRTAWLAATALLALAAGPRPAGADVTVERFTKSGGVAGIAAHESTAVEKYAGLRKRETTATKMAGATGLGGFLSKIVGDFGGDTITDVGRDAVWALDHKQKTYTERRIMPPPQEESPGGREESAGQPEQREKAEKPTHRVVRNEITVEETGERKKIGEFDCTRYVITWILETEEIETKERNESTMTTDLWTTPETSALRALRKEETEFSRAYLKKMGLDVSDGQMQQFGMATAAALLGGDRESLEKGAKEVAAKMEKVKGFPIGTRIVWRIKTSTSGPGGVAMEEKGGMPDLGKGLDGLMAAFGRKGAKKEKAEEKAKGSGEAPAKEGPPAFESYTEIRKVGTDKLPDADFTVPSGYKKVSL